MPDMPIAASHAPVAPRTALGNIETIIRLEEEQSQRRPLSERVSDAIGTFVGRPLFVLIHAAWFVAWAAVNAGLVPGVPRFDPYPFSLLCMIVSLEGVLLTTFVLIKQNRMSQRADRRSHLDLQVNMLAEQEVSKVIEMLARISTHLGVESNARDAEAKELAQVTAIDDLARELNRKLPDDEC